MSKFSHDLVIHKSPAEVTLDDILITLEETAEKFAEDQSKMMLSTISDVCDKSGNVINAKQGADPLDQMMAVLEKIEIAFDENGKHNLTIVCGESLAKEYQQVFQKLANDPEAQRRHDEVMARKKVEWDAKQASRKLVG